MSWAGFERAQAFSLQPRFDGQGFHVTPGDPGGATIEGVTFGTFTEWRVRNGNATPDLNDFRNCRPEELEDLRHAMFWLPCAGDRLPVGPDLISWEIAYGSGTGWAARLLKRALGVPENFRLDAATVRTACCQDAASLVRKLSAVHLTYVDRLAGAHRFGRGWAIRIAAAEQTALKWIQEQHAA